LKVVFADSGRRNPVPPQPDSPSDTPNAASASRQIIRPRRKRLRGRIHKIKNASVGVPSFHPNRRDGESVFTMDVVVWTVNVEVAALLPGVRVVGEKEAVAPAGSPFAERLTVPAKAPFCGVTVSV
jgi:hypothetical protein